MPTPDTSAPTVLTQAVLEDARTQAATLLAQARQQGAAVLAEARAAAGQFRQERLQAAQAEAVRRTEALRAATAVEAARMRAKQVETLLQTLYDEARRRLVARQGYDYRAALVALVTEAARHMAGSALLVKLSPADHAAVANRLGFFTLIDDPAITDGGVVVLETNGRRIWDNQLPARLERLWPELRRLIVVQGALA